MAVVVGVSQAFSAVLVVLAFAVTRRSLPGAAEAAWGFAEAVAVGSRLLGAFTGGSRTSASCT